MTSQVTSMPGSVVGRSRSTLAGLVVRQPMGLAGVVLVGLPLVVALLAPVLAPFDPAAQFSGAKLLAPGVGGHLLGTDDLSRDLLSRLLYGTRVSVGVGFLSVLAGAAAGVLLGMVAGYFGRYADAAIMRVCDVLLAYPGILLGVVVVAVLGPGLVQVCVAVGVVNVPIFARLMRAAVLRERELDYVRAVTCAGASTGRLLFLHLLPNGVGVVVTQISASVGHAVLLEAALSFLGLGVQPPTASWGSMLSESQPYLVQSPMFAIAPGLALLVLVLGLNLLSDALRRVLDPANLTR